MGKQGIKMAPIHYWRWGHVYAAIIETPLGVTSIYAFAWNPAGVALGQKKTLECV